MLPAGGAREHRPGRVEVQGALGRTDLEDLGEGVDGLSGPV